MLYFVLVFFFFNQNTSDEVRFSDWSSDVFSSDLSEAASEPPDALGQPVAPADGSIRLSHFAALGVADRRQSGSGRSCGGRRNKRSAWRNVGLEIGRASCRERVCQYV